MIQNRDNGIQSRTPDPVRNGTDLESGNRNAVRDNSANTGQNTNESSNLSPTKPFIGTPATPRPPRSPKPTAAVSALPEPTASPQSIASAGKQHASPTAAPGALTPVLAISAIVIGLVIASLLAKRTFNNWKYGKNAGKNLRSLKKAVKVKNELTGKWLKRRKSANIHAIGVGKIDGTDDYCIQVFVEDANGDMLADPPTRLLPAEYRDLPIIIYEMPRADFLVGADDDFSADHARAPQAVLRGGLSGANANLSSESGTIGYFFRPNFIDSASHIFLKKHVYLLSNSHVFADLAKSEKDDGDLIMHPSPGESAAGKPVAELYSQASIIFGGDVENPNFIDAAIAKLHRGLSFEQKIPRIGKILGSLRKEQVELRSQCQKFGRTTGYTRGTVFSIHLSIWVKYSARGTEAFFKDQFLIVPTDGSSFVKPGDSGSLLADFENHAIGLIFAGAGSKTVLQFADAAEAVELANLDQTPKIEHFGVANSISDVMREFRIKIET